MAWWGKVGQEKTTLGRTILKASPISKGMVYFYSEDGTKYDIAHMNRTSDKHYRAKSQMIFQDPYSSLSPRMTIRDIIAEPLEVMATNHPNPKAAGLPTTRTEIDAKVIEISKKCQIDIPLFETLSPCVFWGATATHCYCPGVGM